MSDSQDLDDLFGLPSSPAPAPAAGAAQDKPADGIEARKEARVTVKWQARVLQPDGQVVPLRVRDISETGVGLVGESPIASHASLRLALAVPDLNVPGKYTTVTGTFKTAHVTVSGRDLLYGGVWLDIQGDGRELIRKWIRKLGR